MPIKRSTVYAVSHQHRAVCTTLRSAQGACLLVDTPHERMCGRLTLICTCYLMLLRRCVTGRVPSKTSHHTAWRTSGESWQQCWAAAACLAPPAMQTQAAAAAAALGPTSRALSRHINSSSSYLSSHSSSLSPSQYSSQRSLGSSGGPLACCCSAAMGVELHCTTSQAGTVGHWQATYQYLYRGSCATVRACLGDGRAESQDRSSSASCRCCW